MKKFPSEIERIGKGHKIVLNDEQREWLIRWFPTVENKRLAKAMGISETCMRGFVRELGLKKSEEGWKAIKRRHDIAAAKTNHKNGCYDRKRGHPCSAATMAGVHKRWADERAGLRENAQLRIKREEPERYKAWMETRSKERKESIRKEKMRIKYGLDRKTRIPVVVMTPFKESQRHHRYNALRRGYFLDVDSSEGSPNRYVIFYDDNTERSAKFEENCIKDGFTFVRE